MLKKLEKFWEFGIGRMALAAFCAHSVSISIGMCQGYSAVWIPQLESLNEFGITSTQSSWLASLGAITNPIGSILSGVLAEWLGRKRSIQISSIPFIIGWVLIGLGRNIAWLYAGRLITGIAAGMSTASYTYVGEITTPTTRGFLQTLGPICASFGILLTYVLGYVLHWTTVALISTAFAVFSMITMQAMPESPAHLVKISGGNINEKSDAYKAYFFFSRNIVVAQQEIQKASEANNNEKQPQKSLKELYLSPETTRPFCLLVTLFLLQELSGIYTILYYAVQFFAETNLQIDDYVSSITVGTIRFAMSIVCAFLINKLGRKTLCTFSSFGMTLSVLILGLYVKYYEIYPDQDKILKMLPLFCVIFNVLFSMVGMLPIPWILCGELFPLRVRPIMAGVVICMAQTFIFICVKIYYNMVDFLGFSGTIFTFFVASTLSMFFCKYVLPETRNKSLEEIEAYFRGSKKQKDNLRDNDGVENRGFDIQSEEISVVTR
ncbi:facilitated trehalose transporter Tret1-like [Sitophilus oryzae]|uniref:Facilitated trehalose transporter Tret1-like n=1 Tax=Sitophilus oryzae TaxID=7048 RepID=A0A6J2XWD7_SITOR|nr:facilitated trehalose transporter Tret1-like [Sitophilus oryzae]XP_030754934.1 facilitated trehalose transporter Tret1-like [Sitophilus oryzae]